MGYPRVVSLPGQAQGRSNPTLHGAALLQGASTASHWKMFPDGGCFGVSCRRDSFPCYHSLRETWLPPVPSPGACHRC